MTSKDLLSTLTQSFKFSNEKLPDLEPFEFTLEETLSLPYTLNLRLLPTKPNIDESVFVGESCTLTLMRGGPGGLVRHINGLVAHASFHAVPLDLITPEGSLPTGVVDLTIVPALSALSQRRSNRIFQGMKVTEILEQVLREDLADYGRKVTLETTTAKYQQIEYCTQYDETDLEFVQRLMATEGIMSYFRQTETTEELVLFDDASKYMKLVTLNHEEVFFEANQKGGAVAETISGFEVGTKMTPTSAVVRFFNWSSGVAPDETPEQSQDAQGRTRELYDGDVPVTMSSWDEKWNLYKKTSAAFQTKLIKEVELAQRCVARGSSNVSGMTAGTTFAMTNAVRSVLNQNYLIIGASHQGVRPGNEAEGSFAGDATEVQYTNTFHCVPADVLIRLQRPPRRAIQTLQTAIVVGEAHEDVTTDAHGRIKVQFHWDRQGKNDIKSSCWIRVAQFSAGMGYGALFVPRKGQEVVVAFLEGDPDKPLVVGSLYNGAHPTPYDLTGQHPQSGSGKRRDSKTRSVIRTRSTPDSDGYNEISFEDAKGSEEIYVHAQKDMNELIKNDHALQVNGREAISIGGDQAEGVGGDQSLKVSGGRTRHVAKDETVVIDGHRHITVSGGGEGPVESMLFVDGKHILDATELVVIRAPRSISLECGDSKIIMEPNAIRIVSGGGSAIMLDANVLAQSKHKSRVVLDANALVQSGDTKIVLDVNALVQSSSGSKVLLDADATVSGTKNVTISSPATVSISSGLVKLNS